MGYWVPTSIREVSLSRVTVRGEEIIFVSAYVLRKDKTAFTPSAFRKKVLGLRPRAVSIESPPLPSIELRTVLAEELGLVVTVPPPGKVLVVGVPGAVVVVVPVVMPLPKLTFCALSVPDQSTPFEVAGFTTVSSKRASMSTCLVWVSRLWTSSSTAAISFSVATRTNWLVRVSGRTLLRLGSMVPCTLARRLEGLAYLS